MQQYDEAFSCTQKLFEDFGEYGDKEEISSRSDEELIRGYLLAGKRAQYRARKYSSILHDEKISEEDVSEAENPSQYFEQLATYLEIVRVDFDQQKQKEFFDSMSQQKSRTEDFLSASSLFKQEQSLLFVLREWNSFTPAIPDEYELDRGGGYFILHKGEGIVIDPGYDFVKNFFDAGGRIHDITHIIITHAHDDHTAELERLLMLIHQYNRGGKQELITKEKRREIEDGNCLLSATKTKANPIQERSKKVKLYLSQGVARKFSGIILLRDCGYIDRVVVLSRPEPSCPQEIPLSEDITLHVLPAYHDDVITQDTAVGLRLTIRFSENDKRTVVFTGDTGLFPIGRDPAKEKFQRALYKRYPSGMDIDLLVAHIGSLKEEELKPLCLDQYLRQLG